MLRILHCKRNYCLDKETCSKILTGKKCMAFFENPFHKNVLNSNSIPLKPLAKRLSNKCGRINDVFAGLLKKSQRLGLLKTLFLVYNSL